MGEVKGLVRRQRRPFDGEKARPAFFLREGRYFATLSPMQQERVLTQIHTMGYEDMVCFLNAMNPK